MPRGKKPVKGKSGQSIEDLVPMSVDERQTAMHKIASKMSAWRPARQVLRRVQAVPTIFPSFDRGIRVGGMPIARIMTIHGPYGQGKTLFSLGLELSFLMSGHFVAHVDAEMTTPITWCEKLMASYADHPGFLASRPGSFEEVDDNVRSFLESIETAKENDQLPKDMSALVTVDSIRKLVPKNLLKNLLKGGASEFGMDGMRGRGAMHKANLNAQWMDEMVPILHNVNAALLLIARESQDTEADAMDRKYGRDYKVGGGEAVKYDASILARVYREKWIYQGADADKKPIGEKHCVLIRRTKVSGKEEREIETFFHTSNGTFVTEGFDRPRDIFELAREMQIVTGDGWYSFNGERLGQGENQCVKRLHNQPELLADIEKRVRSGFVVEGQDPEPEVEEVVPPPRKKRKVVAA